MKYFNRRFKTRRGVVVAIFIKRIYDWLAIHARGDRIITSVYGVQYCCGYNGSYYRIMNLTWTRDGLAAIEKAKPFTLEET